MREPFITEYYMKIEPDASLDGVAPSCQYGLLAYYHVLKNKMGIKIPIVNVLCCSGASPLFLLYSPSLIFLISSLMIVSARSGTTSQAILLQNVPRNPRNKCRELLLTQDHLSGENRRRCRNEGRVGCCSRIGYRHILLIGSKLEIDIFSGSGNRNNVWALHGRSRRFGKECRLLRIELK